jgi:hypothetical protein
MMNDDSFERSFFLLHGFGDILDETSKLRIEHHFDFL